MKCLECEVCGLSRLNAPDGFTTYVHYLPMKVWVCSKACFEEGVGV